MTYASAPVRGANNIQLITKGEDLTRDEIKEIRAKSKLTQREFGEAIGVSVRTVESWEAGHRNISKLAQRAICVEFREVIWKPKPINGE